MERRAAARAARRRPRLAAAPRRGLAALVAVLVGVALCRVAGAYLPPALASGLGVLVVLGLPGFALLAASGVAARVGAFGTLALLAPAALAVWTAPLALAFALHLSLNWALGLTLAATVVLLALREPAPAFAAPRRELAGVLLGGIACALLAGHWQPGLGASDALFHEGRVRKLLDLPGLSISGVSTYLHGAPHAGYAFPLLHGLQAGAIRLTGMETVSAYVHLLPVFAFLAPLVPYAAGRALGGPAVGVAAAMLAVWQDIVPGRFPLSLNWVDQPPTFTFVLLIPAALLVAIELQRTPRDRRLTWALAAAAATVAIVHPTYAVPLLALLLALALLSRRGLAAWLGAAAVVAVYWAWIYRVAIEGGHRFHGTCRTGPEWHDCHQIVVPGSTVLDGSAAFLLALGAMLVLLLRSRGAGGIAAALMLGGLVLVSLPGVPTVVNLAVGVAQTRRFWVAIPWQYAAACALALAAARLGRRRLLPALALLAAASLLLQAWDGWNAHATLITVGVAGVGLLVALWRIARADRVGPSAAPLAAVLPTALLALALMAGPLSDYSHGAPSGHSRNRLSPGAIAFMRRHDNRYPFPVVLAEPVPAYTLTGYADVYVVAMPAGHTRAEPKTAGRERLRQVNRFLAPGTSSAWRERLAHHYQVDYVMLNRRLYPKTAAELDRSSWLRAVYHDRPARRHGTYVIYAVR